jgi:hypothetical protein
MKTVIETLVAGQKNIDIWECLLGVLLYIVLRSSFTIKYPRRSGDNDEEL